MLISKYKLIYKFLLEPLFNKFYSNRYGLKIIKLLVISYFFTWWRFIKATISYANSIYIKLIIRIIMITDKIYKST